MKTLSKYAKLFDEHSFCWTSEVAHNKKHIDFVQKFANDRLRSEKTVFLNDVYKMFGLPRTKAGQVVGWHYDENNPIGDNKIILEFEQVSDIPNRFVIDFNVDGDVRKYLED